MTPKPVATALRHVRDHFPDVTFVLFTPNRQWMYLTDDGEAPAFEGRIDVGILEDAVDSVIVFPSVYSADQLAPLTGE